MYCATQIICNRTKFLKILLYINSNSTHTILPATHNLEITLNIKFHGIRGNKNIQQSLKFSPWCLAEEAVEQIVPFFLKQDIIECMI
jgi:hypothetical protein